MVTPRRAMTGKARLAFITLHNRVCHICSGHIDKDQSWDVEHVIPLAMGGDNEPGNLRPAHSKCHAAKTKQDVANVAKAKRREIINAGAKPAPRIKIKSAPFAKAGKPPRKPMLPARQLYREARE